MLFFKTIQLLLFPSIFFLIFIILGLIFKKKYLIILGVALYFVFSTTFVADLLLAPLEDYSYVENLEQADYIVLLLGGKESNVLRGSEVLRISHLSNHEKTIIISGTNPLNPNSEEAHGVRNFFISRGIPKENIVIEGKSRNTWQNTKNVKEIVQEKPFFLVTSAYHMKRAKWAFGTIGANPIPAPTNFKRKGFGYNLLDFLPRSGSLRDVDLAIKEYFGILYYMTCK